MKIKIKNGKLNWKCLSNKCQNNCCGSFSIQKNKFKKLFNNLNNINFEEILLIDNDKKNIELLKDKKYIKLINKEHYLNLKKDKSCPFFKKGKCSIYKIRPVLCKAYPFYIDLSSGLVIDRSCPGIGAGWTDIRKVKRFINASLKVYTKQINIIKNTLKK